MKDIVCFEVNDWHSYPKFFDEWFDFGNEKHKGLNWLKDLDAYAKENRLCIKVVCVDMAVSLVVTAPKKWVEDNIPEFRQKKWRDYCVYTYPWPYFNDCKCLFLEGVRPVRDADYKKRRESDLEMLRSSFTKKEIEAFKPHNIVGSPSGENFLDWVPENYGANEWVDGCIYKEKADGT